MRLLCLSLGGDEQHVHASISILLHMLGSRWPADTLTKDPCTPAQCSSGTSYPSWPDRSPFSYTACTVAELGVLKHTLLSHISISGSAILVSAHIALLACRAPAGLVLRRAVLHVGGA